MPDDCKIDTASTSACLRKLLFRDLSVQALHPTSFHKTSARVRVIPAHGEGVVVQINTVSPSLNKKRIYALPNTTIRTEVGPVKASEIRDGYVILPSGDTVSSVKHLFVQADFCRLVSVSPVYVPVSGVYVLTSVDRTQERK